MITIVSGLPRSGTSLMMQMLVAGGMTPLADGERTADADNPRGYLEWQRIKTLPEDPGCIVVFMQRPLPEVLASQDQMLRRRGTYKDGADPSVITAAFEKHLREVYAWLDGKPYVKWVRVNYHDALKKPEEISRKLAEFLGIALSIESMTQQVDASLYRNRTNQTM